LAGYTKPGMGMQKEYAIIKNFHEFFLAINPLPHYVVEGLT
jgi:hypothetical protein